MEDEEDEELREREKYFFQINFTSSIHFFHPFFNYYNPSPLIQL